MPEIVHLVSGQILASQLLPHVVQVESAFRKYLWVVDLAVAGLCALFLARATASVAESQLIENTPPRTAAVGSLSTKPVVAYSKEFKDILDRNAFCSDCPPFVDEVAKVTEGAGEDTGEAEPQKTAMPLTVMAIMYAPPPMGIKYSVAVLRDTENLSQGAFSVGDSIRDAKIIGIDETRIHFDNHGKREFLDLFAAPEAPANTSVVPVSASEKPAGGDVLAEELARGLKKTGENSYEMQRSTLDSVLGNMSLLSRAARIVPEIRDGKSGGFRLYAVRPEGPFALIGMQNGDVLYGINGLEMTSPEKALEVYSKLKSARHLSVSLERNGQKITKEYTIR